MLDAQRLAVLRSVARRGSFSAAGAELGYTQSAVSQQIATLERACGMPLVARTRPRVRPTAAGEVLLRHADGILARIADAEDELALLREGAAGHLRMVAFPTAGATLLPTAIARFRAVHPAVELSLLPLEVPDARDALASGDCDVALLVEQPGAPADAEDPLVRRHLLDDRMDVVLPVGHRLARRRRLRLDELRDEPWILGRRDYVPDEAIFLDACRAAGFEPRMAFESDDYQAIQGFVAAGVGVALVPDMALVTVREDVVVLPLERAPSRRVVAAVGDRGWRSPALEAMLDVIAEVGAAFADERAARRASTADADDRHEEDATGGGWSSGGAGR